VRRTRYRVVVNLSTRRLSLLRAGRAVGTWAAAVGTTTNPTPSGRFAVSELVRQRDRDGFFGPYIITLTAHSSRLNEFDGGDGRVAIHGTNRPSLLGQRVSHGCIRISNAVSARLGRTIPPGTPVDVLR
jgi:lipoprotein-anchoring transpeptidase ErfK/SrfK